MKKYLTLAVLAFVFVYFTPVANAHTTVFVGRKHHKHHKHYRHRHHHHHSAVHVNNINV